MSVKRGKGPLQEEQFAYDLVGQDLGVDVSHHDTGLLEGGGMVDALIHLTDGTDAALEVTTDADGDVLELWRAGEKHGKMAPLAGLSNAWCVHVNSSARLNRLRPLLAPFLERLERLSVKSTIGLSSSPVSPLTDVLKQMGKIGVTAATAYDSNPGEIRLVLVAWSGSASVGLAPLNLWIDEMFDKNPDVPAKLYKHAGVNERHAFLWATSSSPFGLIYILRDSGPIELAPPPTLPDGVTHLWIGGRGNSMGAIAWSPASGWRRLTRASTR